MRIAKMLNHKFMMEHQVLMGTEQIPLEMGNYFHAFSVNVQPNSHMVLIGTLNTQKQVEARVMMPGLGTNIFANVGIARPDWAGSMVRIDGTRKGTDYAMNVAMTGTASLASNARISYMQSLTRRLSAGGMSCQTFWLCVGI